MRDYLWLYQHALEQKGGAEPLEALLPSPKTTVELVQASDSQFLSALCRRVFRAGLKHSMVDAKWPAFEKEFFGFSPEKLVLISDEALERAMQNKKLIRHWAKIKSIRQNALMVQVASEANGGFGRFLAGWPEEDILSLWKYFAREGSQLGGNSAAYFLRMVGKDTFILTRDVVAALIAQGIVQKHPTTKGDLAAVQYAFNNWREQSGRPFCQLSLMLAFCVG